MNDKTKQDKTITTHQNVDQLDSSPTSYLSDIKKLFSNLSQKIINKISNEKQQFDEMGGLSHVGESVAQNAASLGAKAVRGIGDSGIAQDIKKNIASTVIAGQALDNRIKEEVRQFDEMGGLSHVGEYVAQNAASLGAKAVRGIGDSGIAQDIKKNIASTVIAGQALDNRIKEEVRQFEDMGGMSHVGEYVAQNATSLGVKVAKGMGADKIAEIIEDNRAQMLAAGQKFDDKMRQINTPDNNEDTSLKKELKEQTGTLAQSNTPARARFALRGNQQTKISPLYADIGTSETMAYENNKSIKISLPQFKKAEIKELNDNNGRTVNFTLLDGKKHGFEIVRNAEGKIECVNIYDHGKKLDKTKNAVDIKTEEKDGVLMEYGTLNGQIFGTQTLIDQKGNVKVAFYQQNGELISNTRDSQITCTTGNLPDEKALLALTQQKAKQL